MTYYPVIIPTLNRYEHFKRCVESLARNTHADKTELIIGLDYPPSKKFKKGYKQIKEYIPSIAGFKKITVFERRENYGASGNLRELKKYAFSNYDAVISTEDDNEFSPCFLDYMNKALEKYKSNVEVTCVTGYNNTSQYHLSKNNVFFAPTGAAWGMGQWRHKRINEDFLYYERIVSSYKSSWIIFKSQPGIFMMLMAMVRSSSKWGDIMWTCHNVLNNKFQLCPDISMVRNWGCDGSGLHSGIVEGLTQQEILSSPYFIMDEVELKMEKKIKIHIFFAHLHEKKFKAIYQLLKITLSYILFRLNMKR